MIPIDNSTVRATYCLHYWLCYVAKASDNDKLIAESALKYPFVESLERHNAKNVKLEDCHPLFKKRRIDVSFDKEEKESSNGKVYVEFKFVREDAKSTNEQQRYFNDIVRLWSLNKSNPYNDCYLIVSGPTVLFCQILKGKEQSFNTSKGITECKKGKKEEKFKENKLY